MPAHARPPGWLLSALRFIIANDSRWRSDRAGWAGEELFDIFADPWETVDLARTEGGKAPPLTARGALDFAAVDHERNWTTRDITSPPLLRRTVAQRFAETRQRNWCVSRPIAHFQRIGGKIEQLVLLGSSID